MRGTPIGSGGLSWRSSATRATSWRIISSDARRTSSGAGGGTEPVGGSRRYSRAENGAPRRIVTSGRWNAEVRRLRRRRRRPTTRCAPTEAKRDDRHSGLDGQANGTRLGPFRPEPLVASDASLGVEGDGLTGPESIGSRTERLSGIRALPVHSDESEGAEHPPEKRRLDDPGSADHAQRPPELAASESQEDPIGDARVVGDDDQASRREFAKGARPLLGAGDLEPGERGHHAAHDEGED